MSQEGFGAKLTASGFSIPLVSVKPPVMDRGDGIPATNLANVDVETFDVPKLIKVGSATFSADVTELSTSQISILEAGDNILWTAEVFEVVRCAFWGYLKVIDFAEATSDSGTRHIVNGEIFVTNKNTAGAEVKPSWSNL